MSTKPIAEFIEKPMSGEWGVEPTNGHSIGVIRNANFTNEGVMDLSDIAYREIPEKKVKQKALKHGDIIIEKSGGSPTQPVGRVIYYDRPDGELMFSNFTAALRPRAGVDSRFVFYMLWATHLFKKTSAYQNKTTGIANLQLERYINEVEIPHPPLPAQRRIAAVLDKAQALVANDKRTLALYDQLARSLFLEMFGDPVMNERGWEVVKLGELCDVRDGTHASPQYVQAGYPLVTSKNVKDGFIDLTGVSLISEEDYHEINKRSRVDRGDIIMPMIGTIGNPVLVDIEPRFAIKNVALIKFHPESQVVPQFVHRLLTSHYFDFVTEKSNRGGTQKFLALGDIRSIPVPCPPTRSQTEFTNRLLRLSAQRERAEQSLRQSEALFGSLLQGAFNGEIF